MAFVPLYAGVRLSLERNDANIDLLFVTTITPGAIVRGKYFAAMALTLLIFSACMPFMMFTYLLRGIDLPTIFYLLAMRLHGLRGGQRGGHLRRLHPGKLVHARTGGRGNADSAMFWIEGMTMAIASGGLVRCGMGGMMSGWQFWAGVGSYLLLVGLGDRPASRPVGGPAEPKLVQPDARPAALHAGMWLVTGVAGRSCGATSEGSLGRFIPG